MGESACLHQVGEPRRQDPMLSELGRRGGDDPSARLGCFLFRLPNGVAPERNLWIAVDILIIPSYSLDVDRNPNCYERKIKNENEITTIQERGYEQAGR